MKSNIKSSKINLLVPQIKTKTKTKQNKQTNPKPIESYNRTLNLFCMKPNENQFLNKQHEIALWTLSLAKNALLV